MRHGQKRRNWVGPIVGVVLAVGIGSLIAWECRRKDDVRAARDRFLTPLYAGDLDAAYAELSAERRAVMSRAQFGAFIQHPVFLDPNATFYPPEEDAPGWCIDGVIDRPEGEWAIQMFLLQEDDGLHVHALALQQPAKMQLASLVAPCGFWEGTLVGYHGPLPDPTTQTTRSQW